MKINEIAIIFMSIVAFIVALALIVTGIDPDRHESDPEVYERYVEDLLRAGRKPTGEPIEQNNVE